ncbi:thrombopoietin receptor [Scophthalmus maximus]|uniref:thrombopoietin receptor n=1 Tax=Scophthalmus maximus TaxID=52904 RepID=UPI001FA90D8D|nr:thrombopoietin receptor [Scophthalmus maximus]
MHEKKRVIPQSTMNSPRRWEMLLIIVWIEVSFVPGILCKDEAVRHLSRKDVLRLKEEQDPKCFTRTGRDFTCFFEAADNRTYDLLYKVSSMPRENRCDVSVLRPEEDIFLHVCSFPSTDVLLFVEMHLEVVEHDTNASVCRRTVSVEDHFLLDPPFNVTLHRTGEAGQLLVSWHARVPTYCGDAMYSVRYSSRGVGETTEEVGKDKYTKHLLDSLVPGEETEVQVSVKCASSPSAGHWRSWSQPVRVMVPQSADDASLMCFTCDLQNVTCQWNGSKYGAGEDYKLFYKFGLSGGWTECLTDGKFTDLCRFHGDESRKIRVKLCSTAAPLTRTFYTQEFTLNKTIKTSPPGYLRGILQEDKLCLKWEAPLPALSAHLQYEVSYRTTAGEVWMMVSLEGPETHTCVEVSTGSQYNVKVRARPDGAVYSGHWSDWSDVLTGHNPTDTGLLLALCIPVLMLITAIFLISTYLSKLKQYFWPPVPNLEKVLQGFLTEIDRQRWDPPLPLKQWSEEATESVVEIISEDGLSGLTEQPEEPTRLLLPPEGPFPSGGQAEGDPGTDVFPDYVTLSKGRVILCPKRNNNTYETVGERVEGLPTCRCSCADGSVCVPPCSASDFQNYSYEPLAEAADRFDRRVTPAREPGNLYTNLPCS